MILGYFNVAVLTTGFLGLWLGTIGSGKQFDRENVPEGGFVGLQAQTRNRNHYAETFDARGSLFSVKWFFSGDTAKMKLKSIERLIVAHPVEKFCCLYSSRRFTKAPKKPYFFYTYFSYYYCLIHA